MAPRMSSLTHKSAGAPSPAHEYDRTVRKAPVIALEIRNAELMESITRQAAEQGITYDAIVAVPDNEQIVFAEAPQAPADRGRITDTRVSLP